MCRRAGIGAALVCAALLFALVPAGADARRGIETGFADQRFFSDDAFARSSTLDLSVQAGASYARIPIAWGAVEKRPAADPTDPADPAYTWGRFERAIQDATARGLEVVVTIHRAPAWAQGPNAPDNDREGRRGTWKPDAERLGAFATALARRFDGTYWPDGVGEPLPRVRLFEPWNEPNLTGFLAPQWVEGKKLPYGPRLYRRLLNSVYDGVKTSQPDALVIAGGTGPLGGTRGSRRTRPRRFFRELFCLTRGKRPDALPCPEPARFDVLSHHPISPARSPRRKADRGDLSFQEMPQLRRLLRAAERNGTVQPGGLRRQLWATETWWQSSPPAGPRAPSERLQARRIADALRVLWTQRIPVALLYQVLDDEVLDAGRRAGWATGVVTSDGRRKDSFSAARFPFVADRVARKRVAIWTRAPVAGRLKIRMQKRRGGFRTLRKVRVDAGDVVKERFRLRRGGKLRALVGGEPSLSWRVPRRRITR